MNNQYHINAFTSNTNNPTIIINNNNGNILQNNLNNIFGMNGLFIKNNIPFVKSKTENLKLINFNGITSLSDINEIENYLAKSEKIDESLHKKIKGYFIKIITNQHGSRIFQKYLKNTSYYIISQINEEIVGHLIDLMIDSYGNYFCQKFFGCLYENDRIEFLNIVTIY